MKVVDIPRGWKKALMAPLVALMFEGTDEDPKEAWQQAIDYVRVLAPHTELEFRLVVRMAILNLQSNNASLLSTRPDLTVNQAIRLQANALALANAADKAETRFKQLQSARLQRARATDTAASDAAAEPAPTPATESTPEAPKAQPRTAKDEARAINEYARKNRMTYAQAWARHQRDTKLAEVTSAGTPQS